MQRNLYHKIFHSQPEGTCVWYQNSDTRIREILSVFYNRFEKFRLGGKMSSFGKKARTHVSFKTSLDAKEHHLSVSSVRSRSNNRVGSAVSRGGSEDVTLLAFKEADQQ